MAMSTATVMPMPSRSTLRHDRASTLAAGPPVRERPPELLLEREEEAGRERERGEPHRLDRLELVVAAQRVLADPEEGERRDAGDEQ